MRSPKHSLARVPGHYEVGSQVTDALEHIIKNRPEVTDDVFKAIGDTTKAHRGAGDEVAQMSIPSLGKLGVTELHVDSCDRWVRMSGDLG